MIQKKGIEKIIILSVLIQIILIAIGKMNQLLLIGTFFIQFVAILYYLKYSRIYLTNNRKKMIFFLMLLFAIVLFMSIFSKYRNETVITTISVFINIIFICFINFLDEENYIFKKIIKYFFIFLIFLAIYGIFLRIFGSAPIVSTVNGVTRSRQFLRVGGITLSQIVMGQPNENYGIASLTPNPNSLSYFLIDALIINTVFTQYKNIKKQKVFVNYIFYIIIIIGIILAGSRLAIILIPIAYLIPKILFMKNKKKIKIIIITTFFLFFLILLYLILTDFPILESINLNGRELLWNNVPEIIYNHVFLGEGIGSSILILEEMLGVGKASMHNTYFVMFSDFGLFTTLIVCVSIIFIIVKSIKNCLKDEYNTEYKSLLIVSISFMIIILIQGLSESTIFTLSVQNILFFYMLATLVKLGGMNEKS